MSDEKRRILEMLAEGTITQEDAERLLDALGEEPMENPAAPAEEIPAGLPGEPGKPGFGQMITNAVNRVMKKIPELTLHPELEVPEIPEIDPEGPEGEPVQSMPLDDTQLRAVWGQKIQNLYIHWINGVVQVAPHDGEEIIMTETANKPLEDWQRLVCVVDEEDMHIYWCERSQMNRVKNWNLQKNLQVQLPREIAENLEDVEIKSASGPVQASDLKCEDLLLASGSGPITAFNIRAEDAAFKSGSGPVSVQDIYGEDIQATSGSGAVEAREVHGEDVGIRSGSGAVTVNTIHGEDIAINSASGRVDARTVHGEDVNISSASGSVYAFDVWGDDVNIHSASGKLEAETLHAEGSANIHSVSGSVRAEGLEVHEGLNLHTVSGSIQADLLMMPESIRMKTVSGSAQLILPDTPEGFNLKYSGGNAYPNSDFHLTGELKKNGGHVTYGEGETDLNWNTVTGGLTLKKGLILNGHENP